MKSRGKRGLLKETAAPMTSVHIRSLINTFANQQKAVLSYIFAKFTVKLGRHIFQSIAWVTLCL
ncbi:MAG: hypothetical protein D3917_11960 [Candidatus Electrothrix sp. AX5]|nr:hypothetical protein [Candidatus Electrothrix sp. AX5]